jgi:hypothetical protein
MEGLTFGLGPRRWGFNADCCLYSASRRMISLCGTDRTLRTRASNRLNACGPSLYSGLGFTRPSSHRFQMVGSFARACVNCASSDFARTSAITAFAPERQTVKTSTGSSIVKSSWGCINGLHFRFRTRRTSVRSFDAPAFCWHWNLR